LTAILALPVPQGSDAARAELLSKLAEFARLQADYATARAYHEESLSIGRALGDHRRVAIEIRELGRLASNDGDTEGARLLLEEALAAHRRLGDRPGMVLALTFLGIVDFLENKYEASRSAFEAALALQYELNDQPGIAVTQQFFGLIALKEGNTERATSHVRESLRCFASVGPKWGVGWTLSALAAVAAQTNQPVRAMRLAGAAATLAAMHGTLHFAVFFRDLFESPLAEARAALAEDLATAAWSEGARMPLEDAVEYALRPVEDRVSAGQLAESSKVVASRHPDGLTEREVQVLRLIAAGKHNQEIAEDLVVSVRTVERHITNLYIKIGARGKADATAYAIRRHLV
jgi:DNA-binding CsgD family transcriptional regulator/tetratricopeptide (TPR) repeat protein